LEIVKNEGSFIEKYKGYKLERVFALRDYRNEKEENKK
jgi:hypothetical protein